MKKLSQGLNLDLPKTFSNLSESIKEKQKIPPKPVSKNRVENEAISPMNQALKNMKDTPEMNKKIK